MKRKLLLSILGLLFFFSRQLFAQSKIGDNSSKINPSVLLELESKKKGFLLPRMNSTQMSTIVTPPVGLQVFNTDSSCICLFTNTGWRSLCNNNVNVENSAWTLKGNNATSTQFLGTKNNSSLRIRTNNQERAVVDSVGNVGIGTSSPASTLDIKGSFSTTIKEVTNNYTLNALDHIIAADTFDGNIVVKVPSAVGIKGRQYVFKKVDESNNQLLITALSGQKIDGDTQLRISIPWQTKTIVSNGKNWLVISNQ